jgi:hypothetical protein
VVQPGFFVLHPAVLPPLTAGRYRFTAAVEDMPHGPVSPLESHVTVSAPRFTMPPDQILSTYPPANREGAFQATLPQIVLKRRTLPWERTLDPGDPHLPWLALVVIAEGEGALSKESPVEDCFTPGTLWPDHTDRDVATSVYLNVTQTVVNQVFPTKEDVRVLAHVREVEVSDSELAQGDDDGFLAVVIANRLPQPGFDDKGNLTPRKYLASLINLEGQTAVLPPPTPDPLLRLDFEALAVVEDLRPLANAYAKDPDRFVMGGSATGPAPAARSDAATSRAAVRTGSAWAAAPPANDTSAIGRSTAAIDAAAVSVGAEHAASTVREAMASAWRFPIEVFTAEPTYRFPVLAYWSFTVNGDPTFAELMRGLDVGLLGTLDGDHPEPTQAQKDRAALSNPPPKTRPTPELAETGHVGLAHQTRRGDRVTAWYRGPLSPHPTVREQPGGDGRLPFAHTSDQLRVVVPDGREDVSLAAAFEIGRLLALAQPAVVTALMRWRGEQFGAQRAAELAARTSQVPGVLDGVFAGRRPDLGALVARHLVLAAGGDPAATLAASRPLADPGRPLTFADGDLDAAVAKGLGLNLDALLSAARSVGLTTALTQTEVPVTRPPDPGTDPMSAAHLTTRLDAAVQTLAADVLEGTIGPPGALGTDGAPGTGRAPDALDALLARFDDAGPAAGARIPDDAPIQGDQA